MAIVTHQPLQCLSLLRGCKTLSHLKQVQPFVLKSGLDADPLVAGKIILVAAITLTDESDHPNHSLLIFNQMRRHCLTPDSFSFAFLLKAAANCRTIHAGAQLHSLSIHHGLDAHLFVGTTLVSMYAECGCIASARKAFDKMPQPNVVAWNAVVTACFRSNDIKGGEDLFAVMPWRNQTSWNLMLAGYTKAGELESARRLFYEMPQHDPVSWSTMIVGFASNGHFDDACSFFRDLLREGLKPNEVSLTGILSACAQSGAFENGKILHGHIMKAGFSSIVAVTNALLDMYSRCGSIEMADQVFIQEMGKKNIISWTSMIAAFAMYGYGEEAIKLFSDMEEFGTKPDWITFISILYACSHAGLVDKGREFFHIMTHTYRLSPSIEHYGCMVDLYGRAGLLDEAYEFATRMPIEPNAIIWRTLLGACSIHGNVKLAELVKQRLSELDPNDAGDYVLLSNIYAVAGKWKDVAEVRGSMSKQSIKKDPGWSSIEVDKAVYKFVAGGDGSSRIGVEANKKLVEIMEKLKDEGYMPGVGSVLHDIEDEEKEGAIVRHSEKLAVAFGIARTGGVGKTIRIVKNLRVCRDCHVVMKMISKVYGREIIVRDRSRFHSFRAGSCSCGDYW
ncbi:pentatricopeptide repeat-containing protein At1g74630 isoform X2 [Asparagus officinalis]|uniref:pentatricopeptide repeat-containing protein At1g74630 isoform X2 n=1 Tax=Asparagus officinalis TaxID=4686 RepID=UPI00098DF1BA|nr:pentatricopeptide repeat-containing protein At1g74630 isoform X2 [Asparagus officinalis]